MKLSLTNVKKVFNDLISSRITRADAEKWVELRMKTFGEYNLDFDPPSDRELLWKVVIYLSGIALQVGPGEYFEDMNGIKEEFDLHWNHEPIVR